MPSSNYTPPRRRRHVPGSFRIASGSVVAAGGALTLNPVKVAAGAALIANGRHARKKFLANQAKRRFNAEVKSAVANKVHREKVKAAVKDHMSRSQAASVAANARWHGGKGKGKGKGKRK